MEKEDKQKLHVPYKRHAELIEEFLTNFEDPTLKEGATRKYMAQLELIASRESQRLEVDIRDLEVFFRNAEDSKFLHHVLTNTKRYEEMFNMVAFDKMPNRSRELDPAKRLRVAHETTLLEQRMVNFNISKDNKEVKDEKLPIKLFLSFNTYFVYSVPEQKALSVGKIRAKLLGSTVAIRALVVRISEVKPMMVVATYNCDLCGHEIYQEVDGRPDFLPLTECVSRVCTERGSHGKISMSMGTSKIIAYQELKVQETGDQLEEGGVPRTFTLVAKRDNVRQCLPGDIIMAQGIILPFERSTRTKTGFQFSSFMEVAKITREKQRFLDSTLAMAVEGQVESLRNNFAEKELYQRLAESISPQTYGLLDVKKALLLQMLGSPTVEKSDGLKIRGDINVALIGDPGVAKSQFLKRVSYLAPRGVYTTGKGSTGVGLTASVQRDQKTGELTLEGGALVLADRGVCCIDEFDKMEENDRTAIHQVMEQQSVSIAKAGIVASLNARTSILAAANPYYGRYDKQKSLQQNIRLPAALLSRFDLLFILLDSINDDEALSATVLGNHSGRPRTENAIPSQLLRAYISRAQTVNPTISKELQLKICEDYVNLRSTVDRAKQTRITPRNLLAMLRLAAAKARLRFDSEVTEADYREALRLVGVGMKIGNEESHFIEEKMEYNKVLKHLDEICSRGKAIKRSQILERLDQRGILQQDFEACLKHFTEMGKFIVDEKKDTIIKV